MVTLISESSPKARKDYHCDASEYVREAIGNINFTSEELEIIHSAELQGWIIRKGTKYHREAVVYDGDIGTFKCILGLENICRKYELYPEN